MTQKPSIGRIVHYVLANGEHRAATVVNAWPGSDLCNLKVDLDAANDLVHGDPNSAWNGPALKSHVRQTDDVKLYGVYIGGSELHVSSAAQDEDTKAPGTWHWPERVE